MQKYSRNSDFMSDIHVIFNFIYSSTQIKKCDKNNWLQNFEKLLGKCLYHRFFSECNMFRKLAVIKRAFWASLHYKGYHARILQDSSFQNFANFSAKYFEISILFPILWYIGHTFTEIGRVWQKYIQIHLTLEAIYIA